MATQARNRRLGFILFFTKRKMKELGALAVVFGLGILLLIGAIFCGEYTKNEYYDWCEEMNGMVYVKRNGDRVCIDEEFELLDR